MTEDLSAVYAEMNRKSAEILDQVRNGPGHYCYEILVRGKWKPQYHYWGENRGAADARAIDRLPWLFGGRVKSIRQTDTKEVIWDRTTAI
jgi:hypothetical protein